MLVRMKYLFGTLFLLFPTFCSFSQETEKSEIEYFIDLVYEEDSFVQEQNLQYIRENWKEDYEVLILEIALFNFYESAKGPPSTNVGSLHSITRYL